MASPPEQVVCTPTFVFQAAFPGFDPRSHLSNFHPNTGTTTTSTTPLQPQDDVQKPKTSNSGNRTSSVKTHTFLGNNDYGTSSRNLLVAATGISTTSAFPGVDPTKMVSAAAAQAAAIVATVEKQEDVKDRLWPCPACKVPFKTAYELQAHLSHHTKGERTVPCEVCGKLFVSAERVRVHMRSAHGEKSCSCEICGSGFSYRCKLMDHMRTHTGDKPFHCDVCGKSFSQKNHLTRHSMIHTGERPYPCDFCGRGFYRKDKLSRHRRIHTGEKPYICLACGKAFYRRDKLTRHFKMHSGEKPFTCSICGKRFIEERDLKRHKCSSRHLNNYSSNKNQSTAPSSGTQQLPENQQHQHQTLAAQPHHQQQLCEAQSPAHSHLFQNLSIQT